MTKALLNIMGLKPGETVLDPMMGSGTVLIEASLMEIKSVGIDASPFCQFMAQVKLAGLTAPLEPIRAALKNCNAIFNHFQQRVGHSKPGSKIQSRSSSSFFQEPGADYMASLGSGAGLPKDCSIRTGSRFPSPRIFKQRRLLRKEAHAILLMSTFAPSFSDICLWLKRFKEFSGSGLATGIRYSFAR